VFTEALTKESEHGAAASEEEEAEQRALHQLGLVHAQSGVHARDDGDNNDGQGGKELRDRFFGTADVNQGDVEHKEGQEDED
jgi:hypothetical protein